jgi:hypothetical protein
MTPGEELTPPQMTALVERQLQAYNRGDLEAFCECFHPQVQVNFLVSARPAFIGIDMLRAYYGMLFSANPELRCELRSRAVLDAAIVDEEIVHGIAAFPLGLHTSVTYAFRDGVIDRVWFAH